MGFYRACRAFDIAPDVVGLGLDHGGRRPAGAGPDRAPGASHDDQGITVDGKANIVPADINGLAFGRTPERVLNIVYLTPKKATKGGFYPDGVNPAAGAG